MTKVGRYKFRKKDLLKCLEHIDDDDFIMVNIGGHTAPSYPITHVEDSTSVGFWEIRCDPAIDFFEALQQEKNEEL